ncbi:hypothetical protein CLV74_101264 [Donghicola tyrosinivorans]|uniref:Uncharacterized protein n=1 Tax=Donghicola tyrosinivorans TaxID=1652492 RepID=A0A2T0X5B4_9RHOB|nr:hypothetical protein CLV74_101264 [Donghicola tyrosinivorans]
MMFSIATHSSILFGNYKAIETRSFCIAMKIKLMLGGKDLTPILSLISIESFYIRVIIFLISGCTERR